MKANKNITDLSIIHQAVYEHFGVSPSYLFEDTNKMDVVTVRQWFHYFARILNPKYKVSLSKIGSYYSFITGNVFDHSTVLHSVNVIENTLSYDKRFQNTRIELLYKIASLCKDRTVIEKNSSVRIPVNCIDYPLESFCLK